MPVYEYICHDCQDKVSILMKFSEYNPNPACPVCRGTNLARIFSGFALHKSLSTIHEESGEPGRSVSPDYYKDPRNIGRHMEKQFRDMNIEMPSEIKKNIEAARGGELPDSLKDFKSASADSAYH